MPGGVAYEWAVHTKGLDPETKKMIPVPILIMCERPIPFGCQKKNDATSYPSARLAQSGAKEIDAGGRNSIWMPKFGCGS